MHTSIKPIFSIGGWHICIITCVIHNEWKRHGDKHAKVDKRCNQNLHKVHGKQVVTEIDPSKVSSKSKRCIRSDTHGHLHLLHQVIL